MSCPGPSFYAIIPANVLYCKEVEPGAKLLYGTLTALAAREGYCWATNKYLGDLYDVDAKTIQRWLASLKDQKFICTEVETGGFQTTRRIWISPEIKKSFTARQKCREGKSKTVTPDDKNVLHIIDIDKHNEEEREEAAPPPPPIPQKIHKRVKIEQTKYDKLCEDFGEPKVVEMMERLDEYADLNPKRFKQYACHAAVIRKWIRDDSSKEASQPQSRGTGNIEWLEKVKKKYYQRQDMIFSKDSVLFVFPYNQECIKCTDRNFREQVINQLK